MSKASRPTGKLCAAGAVLAGKLKFPQPMELIVRKMNSRLDGIIPLVRAQSAPAPGISGTSSISHSVNLATAEIGKMRPAKRALDAYRLIAQPAELKCNVRCKGARTGKVVQFHCVLPIRST